MHAYKATQEEAVVIAKKLWGIESYVHEHITPGCSGSCIVRVTSGERDVVVRFWNMQWADFFRQDLAGQLVASKAGYGPEVFHVDESRGITVM